MKVRVFLTTSAVGLSAWMLASYLRDLPEGSYTLEAPVQPAEVVSIPETLGEELTLVE